MTVFVERDCIDCGEKTFNDQRCRDCHLEMLFAMMQCSACGHMRYRKDEPMDKLGAALWGKNCECPEPRPPSRWAADGYKPGDRRSSAR